MATPIPQNHARFDLADIARITGGELVGASAEIEAVITDSRAASPGKLFIALAGERYDAHRFLPAIAEAGAAAVVRSDAALPEGLLAVRVQDTLVALGDIAGAHRRAWGRRVVALTGSAGKTTTKELLSVGLRGAGLVVHKTAGNLNNRVGLPMTLLALDEGADVAVIEMGTSEPGEIARLTEIAAPEVGLVTLIAAAHTQGIGSIEAVADEKGALYRGLAPTCVAIVNSDDARVVAQAEGGAAARTLTYGRGADADLRLLDVSIDAELRTRCRFRAPGHEELVVELLLLGEAAAYATAAVLSVAVALDLDLREVARALGEARPVPGRLAPRLGDGGVLVLDDSYNANPSSAALALRTAEEVAVARGGRLFAALGDMKELGERSQREHEALVALALDLDVEGLALVGPEIAVAAPLAGSRALLFGDSSAAVGAFEHRLAANDVVLVKGSRSMEMERIADGLCQEGAA